MIFVVAAVLFVDAITKEMDNEERSKTNRLIFIVITFFEWIELFFKKTKKKCAGHVSYVTYVKILFDVTTRCKCPEKWQNISVK